jgi:platelet-activating factor acetylhydrolase
MERCGSYRGRASKGSPPYRSYTVGWFADPDTDCLQDYIFPKGNRLDTAPNNEQGVDQELRNAQIELRLCELEEAYSVLKKICSGDGEEVARQNLRSEGYVGGSSRGLKGVDWQQWKNRFHIDKMTIAGHSFGAATVVEVLRHTDRFNNVQAGIIYDIWGAPIKPPAEAPEHRIHLPLLGINSEAFMYWQQNFDAVMSLMKEAKESGAPAYLLTVRGSVHISQSDFSLLYRGITELLMKATVHPQRAIDLNISTSLEFLRLVAPDAGAGKSLINRAMTDEGLLETELLGEVPNEHRPTDQWIAAKLKVPHEFRTRLTAGVQRHFKKKSKKGEAAYNTGDEVWMHFKPTATELEKWIKEEDRGDERIDPNHAMKSGPEDTNPTTHKLGDDKDGSKADDPDVSRDIAAAAKHPPNTEATASGDKIDSTSSSTARLTKNETNSTIKDVSAKQRRDFAAGDESR